MVFDNVMFDIETMGKRRGFMVLSYAFVPFVDSVDGNGWVPVMEKVLQGKIDIYDSVDNGFMMDVDTLKWWLGVNPVKLKELMSDGDYITKALGNISSWFGLNTDTELVKVWSSAPHMDFPMLDQYWESEHLEKPWKYYNQRCVWTYCDGYYNELEEIRVKWIDKRHNAVNDDVMQIEMMDFVRKDMFGTPVKD